MGSAFLLQPLLSSLLPPGRIVATFNLLIYIRVFTHISKSLNNQRAILVQEKVVTGLDYVLASNKGFSTKEGVGKKLGSQAVHM